jgi:hypothetical protein
MRAFNVEDAQMQQMVKEQQLEVLKPNLATKPRVYYKNLQRFTKCFIAGSVTAMINGVSECVSETFITLFRDQTRVAQMETDRFGDFKFDGLEPESGTYQLKISHLKYGATTRDVVLKQSTYLGIIQLGT